MISYFTHPYCSNSTLSAMAYDLGLKARPGGDVYEAYRIGSLFDAVVTEPALLDLIQMSINGTEYKFTKSEYENCRKMKAALKANGLYRSMIKCNPELQREIYFENMPFSYDGFDFSMNMRGKLDFFVPGMVSDLKSTDTTTQNSFEAACEQFEYWRQMVLYCRMSGVNMASIFGVSKINKKVFHVMIRRGDDRWNIGEKQLNELAFKYYLTHENT